MPRRISRRESTTSSTSLTTGAPDGPDYLEPVAEDLSSTTPVSPSGIDQTPTSTRWASQTSATPTPVYQPDRSTRRHPKAFTSLYRWDAVPQVQILENTSRGSEPNATRPAAVHRKAALQLAVAGVTPEGESRRHVWPPAQCQRLDRS